MVFVTHLAMHVLADLIMVDSYQVHHEGAPASCLT